MFHPHTLTFIVIKQTLYSLCAGCIGVGLDAFTAQLINTLTTVSRSITNSMQVAQH